MTAAINCFETIAGSSSHLRTFSIFVLPLSVEIISFILRGLFSHGKNFLFIDLKDLLVQHHLNIGVHQILKCSVKLFIILVQSRHASGRYRFICIHLVLVRHFSKHQPL